MTTAMPKRQEIDSQLTWDTSLIYQHPADYRQALEDYKEMVGQFEVDFKGQLTDSQTIASALKNYEQILIVNSRLMHYAFLNLDVDKMNVDLASLANECQLVFAATAPRLSFLETELGLQEDDLLRTVISEQPQWKSFLENILRQKPHQLTADQEELLANFAPTLRQAYDSYETT